MGGEKDQTSHQIKLPSVCRRVYNVKMLLLAMTLKLCVCACVFKGLNGRKRKTFLSSFVAHLSAAIIPYHENQFGSAPPMTNTAISALLLRRLGQLDR